MIRTIGSYLGISKQIELIFLITSTFIINVFEIVLFELASNVEQAWGLEIDYEKLSPHTQHVLRVIFSGIALIKLFVMYIHVMLLIPTVWPVIYRTYSTLMLPWLILNAVKNVTSGVTSLLTGTYACFLNGFFRPTCFLFYVTQFFTFAPALYMWLIANSYYRDLNLPKTPRKLYSARDFDMISKDDLSLALRRRKVKSNNNEENLRNQIELQSAVDVNDFFVTTKFEEYLELKESRSLDSLLDAWTAELDLSELEDIEPLEEGLTVTEKTVKLLGISESEIKRIILNKREQKEFTLNYSILKKDSPLRLFADASLFARNEKPIRPVKSDIKSQKTSQIKICPSYKQNVVDKHLEQKRKTNSETIETKTLFKAIEPDFQKDTSDFDIKGNVSSTKDIIKPKSKLPVIINKWKMHINQEIIIAGRKMSTKTCDYMKEKSKLNVPERLQGFEQEMNHIGMLQRPQTSRGYRLSHEIACQVSKSNVTNNNTRTKSSDTFITNSNQNSEDNFTQLLEQNTLSKKKKIVFAKSNAESKSYLAMHKIKMEKANSTKPIEKKMSSKLSFVSCEMQQK